MANPITSSNLQTPPPGAPSPNPPQRRLIAIPRSRRQGVSRPNTPVSGPSIPAPAPATNPNPGLNYKIRHSTTIPSTRIPPTNLSDDEKAAVLLHQQYLRSKLHGFTIDELTDAGCWDDPDAQPSNLHTSGMIHPLYQFGKWDRRGAKDLGRGLEGKWDVQGNERLREVLVPSLCLASLLLAQSATWTW